MEKNDTLFDLYAKGYITQNELVKAVFKSGKTWNEGIDTVPDDLFAPPGDLEVSIDDLLTAVFGK